MGIGDHPARRLDRRWAPRYSFRADLEIEWGSAMLRGSTRDISASGMFIEAADPLWVGAGFNRATDSRSARETRLFREADRTGEGHGSVRGRLRIRKSKDFPRPALFALHPRHLIPFYTKSNDTLR